MGDTEQKIKCPSCAHEFTVQLGADLSGLICPHCEAEIPQDALRGEDELAEEIAPGFRPGQELGNNYVIESLLGTGGMAVVFRGRQLSLNRHVAVKILPKEFAKKPMFVERFESEASVLAGLSHQNIVGVIDRGHEGDTYFIVMEYVKGETLKERLARKTRLDASEVAQIAIQVLAGLAYAHERGVVHRDIKPGNIMIDRDKVVKIADFGLAHLAKAQGGLDVTRDNQAMGTLKYMAPEQLASAKNVDGRADLYSLAVCIYEMITGKLPLGMFKLPSEVDRALDVRWDDIILCALKMEPDERYPNAPEMAAVLKEISSTPRVTLEQREKEEDARARQRAEVALTACPNCGHESARTARRCEKCGANLADLFDVCPNCAHQNRIDLAKCTRCDTDLEAFRSKLRRQAEAIQSLARKLASERKFDAALAQLRKLLDFKTREYAPVRESARLWIERVHRRKREHLEQVYEAGQRLIAEARLEQALKIWEPLRGDYKDVGVRRQQMLAQREEALAALKDGSRLYKLGDTAQAIAQFEKAAKFWARNPELQKKIEDARIKFGNQRLKETYLREAEQAANRGDFTEAIALGHRILELDPDDGAAIKFLRDVEPKEREALAREAGSEPEIMLPQRPSAAREPPILSPGRIAAVAGAVGLVVLILVMFAVVIPAARSRKHDEAARLLGEAFRLREGGEVNDAIAQCHTVLTQFPTTPAAKDAKAAIEELEVMLNEAHAACGEVDEGVDENSLDSLIQGFKQYSKLMHAPPISLCNKYRQYAEDRLEDIRKGIARQCAEQAARHGARGEWRQALAACNIAAEQYQFKAEPIASHLKEARRRVEGCDALLAKVGRAVSGGRWDQAFEDCRAALDLVPADPDANTFLARIATRVAPPQGMVLVPAGPYIVGGSEGHPSRTVTLAHGFFIDRTEITNARYAEFVRATGHAPPPGWSEDGRPPMGRDRFPVVNVTWGDAGAFAQWAGRVLPTEAQWECAARGRSGGLYPWGSEWQGPAAVLGFGPTHVAVAEKDQSFCGCRDMGGNVAEWTATRTQRPDQPAAGSGRPSDRGDRRGRRVERPGRGGPRGKVASHRYVVKGSSWAGFETGRPTVPVRSHDRSRDDRAVPLKRILTADPNAPEEIISHRADREIGYIGAMGPDRAFVLVKRWMPIWRKWAVHRFPAAMGRPIGGMARVAVVGTAERGKAGAKERVRVDFSTHCIAVREQPREWLEIRGPAGITRRLPFLRGERPAVVEVKHTYDPAPPPELLLEEVVQAAARMLGRPDTRYLNVGFRCARPVWTPPTQKPAPAKKEKAENKAAAPSPRPR